MRVKDMISALRSKGHAVSVYTRPDGGVRITAIDGKRYASSGNKGNEQARKILNVSLSPRQRSQRATAGRSGRTAHKLKVYVQENESKKLASGYHSVEKITKKEKAFLRKYNRTAKKLNARLFQFSGKRETGQANRIEVPSITTQYFRKGKTRFGTREEIRRLKRNLKRAIGYADAQSVEAVLAKLKATAENYGHHYPRTIAYIEKYASSMDHETLIQVLEMTYDHKNQYYQSDENVDATMLKLLKAGREKLLKARKELYKNIK